MLADQIKINRKKVLAAFKVLRTKGIIAKANYMCCQSCGHSALSQLANKDLKIGWVFWHHQDEDSLKQNGMLSIAFGASSGVAKQKSAFQVGQELVKQLMKQGLLVSWDWNSENRPEVRLSY